MTPDIETQVTTQSGAQFDSLNERFHRQPPKITPTEWCVENLELRTTTIKARFSIRGREYLREMIDLIADDDIHFQTCCMGTGAGKTIKNIAQLMFVFENDPSSIIYALPSAEGQGGAREFNNNAIRPTLEATECFKAKLPVGKDRHNISGMKCVFGGNTMHLAGANSPGQLAGPRRRVAYADEEDKFPPMLGREASADYLLNERTKQVPRSKYQRDSTPSLDTFGIWPHLMASDLRRRHLPCPHCAKRFVLAQSAQYTVLPTKCDDGTQIFIAEMRWDKEAKKRDGTWNLDRVVRSARFECPHCGGHVRDNHREWMDANGVWIPTRSNIVGHRGYHLPSFYAPHVDFESSYGGMAKKFLNAHESGSGMRGYINSELAEVDASQEHGQFAIEINSSPVSAVDWPVLMSCDFQKLYPFIWFVAARWSCFKLQPALTKEQFAAVINSDAGHRFKSLDAPEVACELARFDNRTGHFPLLDFLLAHCITGQKLVTIYEDCQRDTEELGRWIYREMKQPVPRGGDCEIVAAGHCELTGDDAWEELREIQERFHVGQSLKRWGIHPNRAVLIDSGYMEEHNPEVLRKCYESNGDAGRWKFYDPQSKRFVASRISTACRPAPVDCWTPYRGLPVAHPGKFRGSDGIGRNYKFSPDDPFKGLAEADKRAIEVLEAASDFYFNRWLDIRDRQKENREAADAGKFLRGNLWSLSPDIVFYPEGRFTLEQFQAQMNSKGRNSQGEIWERGEGGSGKRRHPDHLNDCCRNMYPHAETFGFFSHEKKKSK